jgi:hypothetical protein
MKKTNNKNKSTSKDMKTTILGILTIIAAVVNAAVALLNGQNVDFGATIAAITAGIGLLKAADAQ